MIVLEGVCKSFDGGAHLAVRDVSFRVPAGRLLVLLGGSGCGKTTTLKMINRLIEPTAGRIEVNGRDVRAMNPVQLRGGIGYAFQGVGLFPHMTVADNVAVVPRLLGWPAARTDARIDELLELVHLPPAQYRSRLPRQLSGGQQQRVGFARALAAGPPVMLLDEPFGALDPITRDELRGEFLQLRRRLGLTAVMVTHDMTEALLSADLIAVMNAGRLLRVGTPRELLTDPGDDFVAALLSNPRRQAEQLESLVSAASGGAPVNPALLELVEDLPAYLGGHLLLSLAALAVGLAVSVPLGIAVSRRPKLAEWALGVAGVIQTVPSLALLALMVPLLGGTIGFAPAFVAMTLYSFLPILANTVIGIKGVDPTLVEAARGLGMSGRQMLLRVQLPLAAPVIIAGIRTATVLVVGTATLATPVGETTLGNYIFAGLNTRDHLATVFGCVCAALLAVVLDQLVHLLELAARRRSRGLAWSGAAGLLLVLGGGLYEPVARVFNPPPNPVVVGSADYTEQHVLSEVLKGHLQAAGFTVRQRKGLGETIEFESLCASEIDCCVDYSGNIWTTLMKRTDFRDRRTVLSEVTEYLRTRHGVTCLGSLGFEDAYALAMPRGRAEEMGVRTAADLAEHAPALTIAGDVQFFRRPEWGAVRRTYGLTFRETRPMDPTLTYSAVSGRSPAVDVICAYTSDGRIKAYDLVVLDDPGHAFPPYDAVLLLSPKAVAKPGLVEVLTRLVGAIDVETMREANRQVDVEGRRPRQAGAELLARINGGESHSSE